MSSFACNGTCAGYEYDGVCQVPTLCAPGTDCHDCDVGDYPWMLLTSAVLALLAGALVLCPVEATVRRVVEGAR